jgi:hypothetical protein
MSRSFVIFYLLGIFLAPCLYSIDNSIQKILTSKDGRSISATILFVGEKEVFVRLNNGREFEIPFERLTQENVSELRNLNLKEPEAPSNPIDGIVIIKTKNSNGSGFFVNQKGRTFIYTNQHVIGDALNVSITDSRGKNVELGQLEVSDRHDIARYRVKDRKAFALEDKVQPSSIAVVYGNSLGAGVITASEANVMGIGPDQIEVDADFVPGNSGGPVLDKNNKVIGVATYMLGPRDIPDWVTNETRYDKTRRFTIRPSRIDDWIPVQPIQYAEQRKLLDELQYKLRQAEWTFDMLSNGKGYLSTIPTNWERDISDILKNHNRLQKKPDSTTTYSTNTSGGYIYTTTNTKSHLSQKTMQKRTQLRALKRFVDNEFKDNSIAHLNKYLKISYFRENIYDGIKILKDQADDLSIDIDKEISLSK